MQEAALQKLRHNQHRSFAVLVSVKPGTGVVTITNTVKEDTKKLTKKDIVV